jgi:mannose-6-phosphate isomerase class I
VLTLVQKEIIKLFLEMAEEDKKKCLFRWLKEQVKTDDKSIHEELLSIIKTNVHELVKVDAKQCVQFI